MNTLVRIYAFLLRLYPDSFRDEFGEEMLGVFALALEQARQGSEVPRFLLRELLDLPAGLRMAWQQAFAQKRMLNPRMTFALESSGAAPTPAPPASRGASWGQSAMAALPLWLIALVMGLVPLLRGLGLLPQESYIPGLEYAILFITVGVVVLAFARRWPRWSAAWAMVGLAVPAVLLSLLLNALPQARFGQNLLNFLLWVIFPLLMAWVLHRISRKDRVAGVAAALPAALLIWLPFMEQTPHTRIPDGLYGAVFLLAFGLGGAAAGLALRRNHLAVALAMSLSVIAAGGLLAGYAGIYYGGMLNFSEPGPSPRALLETALPPFFLSAALLLGPLLARQVYELRLRITPARRWLYRLPLLGLLVTFTAVLMLSADSASGGWQYIPSSKRLLYTLAYQWVTRGVYVWVGLVIYSLGFTLLAWRARLRTPWALFAAAVLFVLLPGIAAIQARGTPISPALLESIPVWTFSAGGLLWLAAALWMALRGAAWLGE